MIPVKEGGNPGGSDSTCGSHVGHWGGFRLVFQISNSVLLGFKRRRKEQGYEEAQRNL